MCGKFSFHLAEFMISGKCSLTDPRVYNASRFMLKLGEHTWGLAGNCVDNIHWTNDQFDKMMKDPGLYYSFQNFSFKGVKHEGHSNYN